MLASSILKKTVRDHTRLATFVGVGLAALAVLMVAVASTLQTQLSDVYDGLPDAFTGLIGGSGSNYVITELFGILAPVGVLVVAISGGVNVIAREEDHRTADLLLTHPVTRRAVVVSKSAVLAGNIAITCGLFAVSLTLSAAFINVDGFGPADALAATVHLFFLGLAFGMIALLAGNALGSGNAAAGISAVLALIANVASGLLPLANGFENGAKLSPWYYYTGSDPVANGISPSNLAVLAALAALAFILSVVVIDHRDIGSRRSSPKLNVPGIGALNAVVGRNVSSIFGKTLTDHLIWVGLAASSLAGLGLVICLMFDGLKESLTKLSDNLPSSVDQLLGASDFGTPVGWVQAEMLSITVPLTMIAIAMLIGVGAVAGEESSGTLGLLMVAPVRRSRIIIEKAFALAAGVILVAAGCWIGLFVGSALGGLDLDAGNLVAAMAHQAALAIFFGMVALALGAAANSMVSLGGTALFALAAYFGDWLLNLRDGLADFAVLSPWHYATAPQPLSNGVDVLDLSVLIGLSVLAVVLAIYAFDRRELGNARIGNLFSRQSPERLETVGIPQRQRSVRGDGGGEHRPNG